MQSLCMHSLSRRVSRHGCKVLRHPFHVMAGASLQAGLEHYEVLDVMAVEQALALLMRRCASLPEQAPPSEDSAKAAAKCGNPSERVITAEMSLKLPRCARKASWTLTCSLLYPQRLSYLLKF